MTTCTRARAILFLQRSTFLNTVNLIIIGGNGIRNQMFLDTCIVQAERNVTIKKKQCKTSGENQVIQYVQRQDTATEFMELLSF